MDLVIHLLANNNYPLTDLVNILSENLNVFGGTIQVVADAYFRTNAKSSFQF